MRPRTWQRYRKLLTLHVVPILGEVALTKLTAQQGLRLYSAKLAGGLSSTTVHHLHVVLHRTLGQADRLELGGATSAISWMLQEWLSVNCRRTRLGARRVDVNWRTIGINCLENVQAASNLTIRSRLNSGFQRGAGEGI